MGGLALFADSPADPWTPEKQSKGSKEVVFIFQPVRPHSRCEASEDTLTEADHTHSEARLYLHLL